MCWTHTLTCYPHFMAHKYCFWFFRCITYCLIKILYWVAHTCLIGDNLVFNTEGSLCSDMKHLKLCCCELVLCRPNWTELIWTELCPFLCDLLRPACTARLIPCCDGKLGTDHIPGRIPALSGRRLLPVAQGRYCHCHCTWTGTPG